MSAKQQLRAFVGDQEYIRLLEERAETLQHELGAAKQREAARNTALKAGESPFCDAVMVFSPDGKLRCNEKVRRDEDLVMVLPGAYRLEIIRSRRG